MRLKIEYINADMHHLTLHNVESVSIVDLRSSQAGVVLQTGHRPYVEIFLTVEQATSLCGLLNALRLDAKD